MKYWEYTSAPCKYMDDIYFIGSNPAPCWLIKSEDGLILLDTGLPQTLYQIMNNLVKIGVDYRDIKHIIHSHGHIDHIGGTRALIELTGAKTYIGYGDEKTVRGNNQLQWANEYGRPFEEPFEPDVVVHDGEKIKMGEKEFLFIATPGHTAGTMSIFFNSNDKGKGYRAGMFGGSGLNSLSQAYLKKYGLPLALREDFLNSIEKVYDYQVEVHLGNHLGDNHHEEKLRLIKDKENPFIDNGSWKRFLDRKRAETLKFFESN